MQINPQPTFLAAVKEIMKTGVAAVALSMEDIFFLANEHCPAEQRIRYGTFQRFIDSLNEYGEPAVIDKQATRLLEIYDYIKAQEAKQKLAMLNGIMAADKDWRRLVWLLQLQEKRERQQAAEAKQLAKEAKERQQAVVATAKLTQGTEGKMVKLPINANEEVPLGDEPSTTDTLHVLNDTATYQELHPLGKVR